MNLENLLKKAKRGVITLGLMAASTIYGCGNNPVEDPIFIYPPSLYGIYDAHWNKIEDTLQRIDETEGRYDMELLTLGSDELIVVNFLSRHKFDRDPDYGIICDSWTQAELFSPEWYMHTVCGNIKEDQYDENGNLTEPAKIDLYVLVDIFNIFNDTIEHLTFELWGEKKPEEEQ